MGDLSDLLAATSIRLAATATGVDDAIRQAGAALLEAGAIEPDYIEAMIERENSVSTYVGEGVAIPHGTRAGKHSVVEDAIVVLRFDDPIDWNGNDVRVVIGLAATGMGYIALLSQLATILLDPARAAALRDATSPDDVYAVLDADTAETE
jgi:PTS system mannitol-specific IIA component